MQIKNVSLFFIGIIISILGAFIIIFDYPQIQYLEEISTDSDFRLDMEQLSIQQRLLIEFTIGIIILIIGSSLLVISFLKRFQNGIRK